MAQYLEICKLSKLDKGESNKKKSIEIRNQTTFAGLSYLLQRRNVDPRLLGNVCNVIFPIGGESESSEDVGGGESHKESKHVKFFIKYIVVVFASGLQTDPVYLITDSNIREDEFHVREVKNLAVTESVGDKGYVVFTKTLLANKGFFLWFMKEIVLKAYDFNRQFYNLPCETHDAYLQVMSEAAECEPMFDMEMVQLLALRRMFVSKLPYATTSLNQLKVLLGPKGYFRRILPESVFDNPPALKAISGVFDEHNTWLRTKKEQRENELFQQQGGDLTEEELQLLSPPLALWDPATIAVAKIALLRIQFANKMTVNQNSIKDSFFEAGIYPFSADRIFENGYTRVPPEIVSHVKSCLDELNRILEARGEILEGDMDELHIEAPVTEKKYRTVDSSCLHRRRTVLLTHSIVLRRELEWRNRAKLAEQQPKKGSSGYVKKRTLQQMAAVAALESYGACDDVVDGTGAAAAAAESGMSVSSAGSSVGSGLAALGMAALTHEPTAEDLAAARSMVFTTV